MLSTIGRKPTIVPVRGNISSAGNAPWPVPKLKTSLSSAIDRAQASAARSIASALGRAHLGKALDQHFEIAIGDAHDGLRAVGWERGDDRVERDFEQFALARGKFGRVDLLLGEPVDRPEAKARRPRAEHSACGQDRRGLHVGRNQSEALDLVAHRVDHAPVARARARTSRYRSRHRCRTGRRARPPRFASAARSATPRSKSATAG